MNESDGPPTAETNEQLLDRPEQVVIRGLLLQPAVYAAVSFLLLLLVPEVPLVARLLLLAGVLLTLRRWGGVLILLLVQVDLFFREGRQVPVLRGADGLFLAFVTVAVLMFVSRQRFLLAHLAGMSLTELIQRWTKGDKQLMQPKETTSRRLSESKESQSSADYFASTFQRAAEAVISHVPAALRGLTVVLVAVTLGRFILSQIPSNQRLTGQLRDLVNEDPTLATGGLILMILLSLWVIIGEVSWRQLTRGQASVYMRSELLRETYGDLRMFVIRRIRNRQKRLLAKKSALNNNPQKAKP